MRRIECVGWGWQHIPALALQSFDDMILPLHIDFTSTIRAIIIMQGHHHARARIDLASIGPLHSCSNVTKDTPTNKNATYGIMSNLAQECLGNKMDVVYG